MVRSPCCEKVGLKKGPWTPEEDQKLLAYIKEHGHGSWRALPAKAGLQRCGKSCRLRWTNYLRPDIKRGKFNLQEEQTIIQLHALLGNRWSAIATHLPRRTDNEIKNHWNTHLKKRLDKMGIDPVTHKPKVNAFGSGTSGHTKEAANLSHMAQWESARLEAEARLVRESKLTSNIPLQNQLRVTPSSLAQLTHKATAPTPARPRCLDVLKAWHGVVAGMFSTASASAVDLLESPTTPLNFPYNALAIPAVAPRKKSTSSMLDLPTTISSNNNNIPCRVVGLAEALIPTENDWKCLEKLNQMPQLMKDSLESGTSTSMALQEVAASSAYCQENAWLMEPDNSNIIDNNNEEVAAATIGNMMMEGISDILGYNSDHRNPSMAAGENVANNGSNCGGDLEENRFYWNNLLDLVEAASPFGSNMF